MHLRVQTLQVTAYCCLPCHKKWFHSSAILQTVLLVKQDKRHEDADGVLKYALVTQVHLIVVSSKVGVYSGPVIQNCPYYSLACTAETKCSRCVD